ncbi:MAG: hypothetical protein JWR50_2863 [Mucilaginibacter sp.]|nr:hypothetical protein [Mucilaginibacter sp.]
MLKGHELAILNSTDMKRLFVLSSLLFTATITFANKVDELKTDSDVVKFLLPLKDRFTWASSPTPVINSTEYIIAHYRCDTLVKTWDIKNWQKLDLNNDGRTDLVAIVTWSDVNNNYIAIDNGDNTFKLIELNYTPSTNCELVSTFKQHNDQLVVFHGAHGVVKNRTAFEFVPRNDTLIYKFGDFIEYNKAPVHRKIKSITYSTIWGWYGCDTTPKPNVDPDQNLEIDKTGNAVYTNRRSNSTYIYTKDFTRPPRKPKTDTGSFKCVIKKADLEEIYNMIDYLNIKKLNDRYAVKWTDDTSCYLVVKFTDGSVKSIADYGGKGTWGLKLLFAKLFALRDSQDWK